MKNVLGLIFPALLCAQTAVTWKLQPHTTPWPVTTGFVGITNNFDSASGTTVVYGQRSFAGTVSVTNGSPAVTWASGDKFSVIWHAPNAFKVNGLNQTIAAGTVPGSCTAGQAISCTQLTMASNWSGSTGTFSFTACCSQIYSDTFLYYAASTNQWTFGPGWGSIDDMCLPDSATYNLPDMRQNSGMIAVDTLRHRLYSMGGVNQSCAISNITTNGSTTVTASGATGWFTQAGLWTGLNVYIPKNGSTIYTIASVTNEGSMQINCGGANPACPNGATDLKVVPPERNPNSPPGIVDMGYLTLNSNPSSNTWNQLSSSSVATFYAASQLYEPSIVYDSDDDGFILFGTVANGSHDTYVFCSADSPGNGTLTARQTAMGCVTSNVWVEVKSGGSPITPIPSGTNYPGLVYDTVNHVVWQFGGSTSQSTATWQTDVWKYCPTTNDGCGTPQKWTAMGSANQPPQSASVTQVPSMVLDTATDTIIFHYLDTPTDYVYDPIGNSWSVISSFGGSDIPVCVPPTSTGTGNACPHGFTTAYDPVNSKIIGWPQGNGGLQGNPSINLLWQGSLAPPLSVVLTVQEELFPGDLTGHTDTVPSGGITRTNESFCSGIPLSDFASIIDASTLGLTGATAGQFRVLARWPSGNVKWLEVCGTVANVSAGMTATVTLTNTGSGNFGTPTTMTSVSGGTTTINTTGGTCGSGSAVCFTMTGTAGTPGSFNGIDTAKIGSTSLVNTGTASGFVVTGPANPATDCGSATPCTTLYASVNDPASKCAVEEDGPVQAVTKCIYSLIDGASHTYMNGVARFYFQNGSSKVRVVSVLENSEYGTNNTFATAYKALGGYEFRMGSALSGTLNYNIGNHTGLGSPTTGTVSGTDTAWIYQGQNTTFGDTGWNNCGSPCFAFTGDVGYKIAKNGSSVQTGTNAQYPVGYADLSNGSGVGIEAGAFFFGANGPMSLEFQGGGSGTDAVRIGLFSAQNTFPVMQSWPQWSTREFYLNFHATAPASLPNEFLKQQQPLIARASITQYNSSGAFFYNIEDPTEEDTYYTNTSNAASPALTLTNMCASGIFGTGIGCIKDVGLTSNSFQLYMYPDTGYNFSQGGDRDQTDWRYSFLTNYIARGHTGRFLQVKDFWMGASAGMNAHSNFSGGWRGKSASELDTQGRPNATTSAPVSTTVNVATGANAVVTATSGSYFGTWMLSDGVNKITINGVTCTACIKSVDSPTQITLNTSIAGAPLTGVVFVYTEALGLLNLRSWSNSSNPDEEHRHWWSIMDYYLMTGDETVNDSLRNLFDDFYLNQNTTQGTAKSTSWSGTGNVSTAGTFTITAGTLPAYVVAGVPISVTIGINTTVYTITNIAGSVLSVTPTPASTQSGAGWAVLGGNFNTRAIGITMSVASRYSQFLSSVGDSSDATVALRTATNMYFTQVKPPLCVSGVPSGCYIGPNDTLGPIDTEVTTIFTATAANPVVITVLSTYFPQQIFVGESLQITGASGTGCSGLNGTYPITNISSGNITLTHDNTGCTLTSANVNVAASQNTSVWTQGISRTRGMHNGARNSGVDLPSSCSRAVNRAGGQFQHSIMQQGLWELRAVAGSSWSDYTTALDLAFGISQYVRSEGSHYDGTSIWRTGATNNPVYTGNGIRDYVFTDIPQYGCDDMSLGAASRYPVRANNQYSWSFFIAHQYEGGTAAWLPLWNQTLQGEAGFFAVGVGTHSDVLEFGHYQTQAVIDAVERPGTATLQTQTITSFVDHGGGSYTISWVAPANTSFYRVKWGPLQIVDWIGYDPVTAAFSAAACTVASLGPITCSGNAATTQPWFASTEAANIPLPLSAGTTQSLTIATGTTGLVANNFMVKAMTSSSAPPPSGSVPGSVFGFGFAGQAITH